MSRTITLTGTSSVLSATFVQPLILDGEYGIGLIDFHTFNSIPNVNETNNIIKIGNEVIDIPIGTYEIDEINSFINSELKKRSSTEKDAFHLRGNLNTMKCEMMSDTLDVDLTSPSSIAPLIGFHKKIYSASKKHESQLPVDVMNVDDIRIECNVAVGSFDNDRPSSIIYSFYPDTPPGFKLIQRPSAIIYYPLNTDKISEIRVRILDQENRLVNFRGERVTLRLHISRQ